MTAHPVDLELGESCPEGCDHAGQCAEDRAAIYRAEAYAESAWLRAAEAPLLNEPDDAELAFYGIVR